MKRTEILTCAPIDHPRLRYVFERIIGARLGVSVRFTARLAEAEDWNGPLVAYGVGLDKPHVHIPVLNSISLSINKESQPDVAIWEDVPCLFPAPSTDSIRFDLPAAVFWMLSRAEEYGPCPTDSHGRFPGRNSLAFQAGFLGKPIVDIWIALLARELKKYFPALHFDDPVSSHQPTYDIDFAWRYLHKPALAQLRTLARDLLIEGPRTFGRGLGVLHHLKPDPYDLYDRWEKDEAVLFFPLGDPSPWDRNHSAQEPAYRALLQRFHAIGRAGLHPSYHSAADPDRMALEVERYATICGAPPQRSRQHFLRMRLPDTYRQLESLGIREDWTMGYADLPGFRAGTAYPYPWYDREQERCTDLMIHPFQAMDATFRHYLKYTPTQTHRALTELRDAMLPSGGVFTTLWHNNSVACVDKVWKDWGALPGRLIPA